MPKFTVLRDESTFVDLQGVTIHTYRWKPGKPVGVVLIVLLSMGVLQAS